MRPARALWVALGCLVLTIAAFALYQRGPGGIPFYPGCSFRVATGLDCPGCGMTRATYAAMHGRLGQAFDYNPLGMILAPLAMTGLAIEIAGWVRGRPLPFRLNAGARGARIIMWAVFAFWVLRNIPYWPFKILSSSS